MRLTALYAVLQPFRCRVVDRVLSVRVHESTHAAAVSQSGAVI
ncbi:MAG TPA: hypothetical protein VF329_04260 [Gammaproteobacteria bacterium]